MSQRWVNFVYCLGPDRPDGPVKIGSSADFLSRVSHVQSHCWEDIKLHWALLSDPSRETKLHEIYEHSRIRGEWFDDPYRSIKDSFVSWVVADASAAIERPAYKRITALSRMKGFRFQELGCPSHGAMNSLKRCISFPDWIEDLVRASEARHAKAAIQGKPLISQPDGEAAA